MPKQPYDWLEPWWHLLQLGNIISKDAAGIILIVTIARIVEIIVGYISPHPWEWQILTVTVTLSEIISYGDLFVFAAFFYVASRHIVAWAKE